MTRPAAELYQEVVAWAKETVLVTSIESVLSWDEQVLLPPEAADHRADQATWLAALAHRRRTDPHFGEKLDRLAESELAADPHSVEGANIRHLKRQFDRKKRLPERLVKELARQAVLGQQAWVEARKNDDYPLFMPHLDRTFALKREEAAALGYEEHPYDALLDDYEPGETSANIQRAFTALRVDLVPLVQQIRESRLRPERGLLERRFPVEAQQKLGREAALAVGFDFRRGRIDESPHPFCATLGPHDIRLTTRFRERHFNDAFFGILHEAGHGLYEQGLPSDQFGLPAGEAISLGVHESQSRLWENFVGRSKPFWTYFYSQLQTLFPEAMGGVSLDAFYFAANETKPSLIRVEADECTYNLHIMVRFELEMELLTRQLEVEELPAAWAEKYQHYLGLKPATDAEGCLQDIHWSGGLIGYFPTYTLGNMYAAALYDAADRELGGLDKLFVHGAFGPLRDWLREKVHRFGQRHGAQELMARVTGQPLSHTALIRHLKHKLGPLYGLT